MLSQRIHELKVVERQLRRCCRDMRQHRETVHRKKTEERRNEFEQKTSKLLGVESKLLFRKIPMCLSRIERCLRTPTQRRKEAQQQIGNIVASFQLTALAHSAVCVANVDNSAHSRGHELVPLLDAGLVSARGPFWSSAMTRGSDVMQTIPACILRALVYFESERRSFVSRELASIEKMLSEITIDLSEKNAGSNGESSRSIQLEQSRAAGLVDIENLMSSVVGRPYLSTFLWKGLLQPVFLRPALGVNINFHLDGEGSVWIAEPAASNFACCLSLGRLCLGVLQSPNMCHKSTSRFVASRPRRECRVVATSLGSEPANLATILQLSSKTMHVMVEFLLAINRRVGVEGNSWTQYAPVIIEICQCAIALGDAIQLLKSNSSLIVEVSSPEIAVCQTMKWAIKTIPNFVEKMKPDYIVRLLVTIFQLGLFDPDDRSAQQTVCLSFATMFPVLSSNTFSTLVGRLSESAFPRRHTKSLSSSKAFDRLEMRDEQKLQSRRIAAALRVRRLTQFYEQNVAVFQHQPLRSVVVVYQMACLVASAPNVPLPARRVAIGAGCILGEALLEVISRSDVATASFGTLITLIVSTCAVVPVARQHKSALGQSTESVFFVDVMKYLLHTLTAKLTSELSTGNGASELKSAHSSLGSLALLCDAMCEVIPSLPQRLVGVGSASAGDCTTVDVVRAVSAFLLSRSAGWWETDMCVDRRRHCYEKMTTCARAVLGGKFGGTSETLEAVLREKLLR